MSTIIKAVIIEDMPKAKELLKADLIAYCPQIELIGEAESVVSGAKLLTKHQPDLIFMDIMLGDGTGLICWKYFPTWKPKLFLSLPTKSMPFGPLNMPLLTTS